MDIGRMVLAVGLVTLAGGGCKRAPSEVELAEARGEVAKLPVRDVTSSFLLNAKQANGVYNGHRIRVYGRLTRLRNDLSGHSFLRMGNEGAMDFEAEFAPAEAEALAQGNTGRMIQVECTITGVVEDAVRGAGCTQIPM